MGRGAEAWGVPLKCDHRPAHSLSLSVFPSRPGLRLVPSFPLLQDFCLPLFKTCLLKLHFLLFRHLVLSVRAATAFLCSKYNYPPTPPLLLTHWILV